MAHDMVPANQTVMDVGPAEQPWETALRRESTVVGAGRGVRSLTPCGAATEATDWSTVGRNDPCPCGSGK